MKIVETNLIGLAPAALVIAGLAAALFALTLFTITVGPYPISPAQIFSALGRYASGASDVEQALIGALGARYAEEPPDDRSLLILRHFDIEESIIRLIPADVARKYHFIPVSKTGATLTVAMSDPTNLAALDEIKFHTGINTDAVLLEEGALNKCIAQWIETQDTLDDGLAGLDAEDLDGIDVGPGEGAPEDDGSEGLDETPIVRFVNKVLIDAIKQGASDIHFEPYEDDYRVRFRTDGILREVVKPPRTLAPRLAARLKVMSLINRASYVDLVESGDIDIAISPQQATIGSLLKRVRRGDVVEVHSLRRGAAEAIEAVAHGDFDGDGNRDLVDLGDRAGEGLVSVNQQPMIDLHQSMRR